MPSVDRAPRLSREQAEETARRLYGLNARAEELPSERDQNFLLRTSAGEKFVLKIANPQEERAVLEMENAVLLHLAGAGGPPLAPRLLPDREGRRIAETRGAHGAAHAVRLLTYLEGIPLAEAKPHEPELLSELGAFTARLALALRTFDHPVSRRDFPWDLAKGPETVRAFRPLVADPSRRSLLDRLLAEVEAFAGPRLGKLPLGMVHNDGNDYNILVARPDSAPSSFGRRSIAGIIDFGDMVHSYRLAEPAVVCAYAMLGKDDPLAAAGRVIAGYHAVDPLGDIELELVYPLIVLRLLMSVAICARQASLRPDNDYLLISNRQAWALLERLGDIHIRFARARVRDACGLTPAPEARRFEAWLESCRPVFGPVLPDPIRSARRTVLDLSVGSLLVENPRIADDTEAFSALVFGEMKRAGSGLGIGRYDEARVLYASEAFHPAGRPLAEGRTVHLGIDLFVEAGTPVRAPMDGVVLSAVDNASRQDYGPTVILEHEAETAEGPLRFWTLYGHLKRDSIAGLGKGRLVRRGDPVGAVGPFPENGDWPPHLHFQVILDRLDREGDFPGVARPSEREVWLSLCPDPSPLLGLPGREARPARLEPGEIVRLRSDYLGRSLSISYKKPLKIVRGFMEHLYDYEGRVFLDSVNNVPHVGHCHPRVVDAVRRQQAVLNTNSRYLHDTLARYAQRLAGLLPDPLGVCFIVNSGSEANDLALRLARNATGRRDMVVLEGAYHGHLTSLIEISPYKFDGPGGPGKPPHTHVVPMPDIYQGPFRAGDPDPGPRYAAFVREAIERARAGGREIAGFIHESLLSCGGQIVLPPGFLREAYRHVRKAGGVCIADEVQVGFGRVGTHFWGFETQGVVPDIVTMGKPIGNGFPLAAVVTTRAIADAFVTGMEYFNTYGGNPVACAAGMAVLDVLEEERLQENALEVGARLKAGLERLRDGHPVIGDVRGLGLFLGVELVLDRESRGRATFQAAYVAERMREEGILVSTDGPFRNVLKIKPPLVFTAADADLLVAALDGILGEDAVRLSLRSSP